MKAFLLIVFLLVLSACGGGGSGEAVYTAYSARQIAERVISEQPTIAQLNYLTPDDDFFWQHIAERYQIDIEQTPIIDGIIFFAGGVIVDEIAVLVLENAEDGDVVGARLLEYASRRSAVFASYAPILAGILANAVVHINGSHVALLVTEDSSAAHRSFLASFSTSPVPFEGTAQMPAQTTVPYRQETNPATPIQEMTEPITEPYGNYYEEYFYDYPELIADSLPTAELAQGHYDKESILRAWQTGNTSSLTPMNRRILDKTTQVLDAIITDGMSLYDKQLAVLNWIIMHSVYDAEFFSNAPDANPNPNNANPYGLLFYHVAICWGFTYTFQLFMDMLGIESRVIYGYEWSGGNHAWNMVNIYGQWYAVDVTLDVTLNNPMGVGTSHRPETIIHRHLNVSNEFLWNVLGHDWDVWGAPKTD